MWYKELAKWRSKLVVGGVVLLIGAAMYPIAISPMLYPEKWQNRQKQNRAGMNKEAIQPGGMKVWSDPFEKK